MLEAWLKGKGHELQICYLSQNKHGARKSLFGENGLHRSPRVPCTKFENQPLGYSYKGNLSTTMNCRRGHQTHAHGRLRSRFPRPPPLLSVPQRSLRCTSCFAVVFGPQNSPADCFCETNLQKEVLQNGFAFFGRCPFLLVASQESQWKNHNVGFSQEREYATFGSGLEHSSSTPPTTACWALWGVLDR